MQHKLRAVLRASGSILRQQQQLCENIASTDVLHSVYSRKCSVAGASIAGHLRHSLDHYSILLNSVTTALSTPGSKALIYYDGRKRNVDMEKNVLVGVDAFRECYSLLQEVDTQEAYSIQVIPVFQIGQSDETSQLASSLDRELWFCAHHAIHHNAMIMMISNLVKNEPERKLLLETIPEGFGLAPATKSSLEETN